MGLVRAARDRGGADAAELRDLGLPQLLPAPLRVRHARSCSRAVSRCGIASSSRACRSSRRCNPRRSIRRRFWRLRCFAPKPRCRRSSIAHFALLIGGFLLFLRSQAIGGLGALAGVGVSRLQQQRADGRPPSVPDRESRLDSVRCSGSRTGWRRRSAAAASRRSRSPSRCSCWSAIPSSRCTWRCCSACSRSRCGRSAPWPRRAVAHAAAPGAGIRARRAARRAPARPLRRARDRIAARRRRADHGSSSSAGSVAGPLTWPQLEGLLLGLFGGLSLFWVALAAAGGAACPRSRAPSSFV